MHDAGYLVALVMGKGVERSVLESRYNWPSLPVESGATVERNIAMVGGVL